MPETSPQIGNIFTGKGVLKAASMVEILEDDMVIGDEAGYNSSHMKVGGTVEGREALMFSHGAEILPTGKLLGYGVGSRSTNIKISGKVGGDGALEYSGGAEILEGGKLFGYAAGYGSVSMQVKGTIIGNYALESSNSAEVGPKAKIIGDSVGAESTKMKIEGEIIGNNMLEYSKGAVLIVKKLNGRESLKRATNISCYVAGTIADLGVPKSGTVVAKKITNYHHPHDVKTAAVYAVKRGFLAWSKDKLRELNGKQPIITKISPSYFDLAVTFSNLPTALMDVKNYIVK